MAIAYLFLRLLPNPRNQIANPVNPATVKPIIRLKTRETEGINQGSGIVKLLKTCPKFCSTVAFASSDLIIVTGATTLGNCPEIEAVTEAAAKPAPTIPSVF